MNGRKEFLNLIKFDMSWWSVDGQRLEDLKI